MNDQTTNEITTVWVLSWRYSDGSSSGVLRAYTNAKRGLLDMELLALDAAHKEYRIDQVPVFS